MDHIERYQFANSAIFNLVVKSQNSFNNYWGWSGGAMVLGKLPVPGRPT